MLTDRGVKSLRAEGGVRRYPDGDRLYLKVTPAGTKTWIFRRQVGGKDRWVTIGRYPAVTLLEARQETAKLALLTDLGMTVNAAWEAYLPHLRRHYERADHIEQRFSKDVLPHIGQRPLDRTSRQDWADLLHRIVERGAPVQANRLLQDSKHFLEYCVERGWIRGNPASGITRKSVGGRERPRQRALSYEEITWLIQLVACDRFHLQTRLALALILVTGQRPSEILGYHPGERVGNWWHLPPERTKPRRAHKVYLPPLARRLFQIAVEKLGPHPFTITHRTLDRALLRAKPTPPFTPHDLRRTMATRLADLGVTPYVVEKMLNHQMEGTMAVYNLAEYLPQRREAWRAWCAKLIQLIRSTDEEARDVGSTHDGGVRVRSDAGDVLAGS